MSILKNVAKTVRKARGRPGPRLLSVGRVSYLTPNMIRVTFSGPELDGFPTGRDGGNCKIMLPEQGESRESFAAKLQSGSPLARRTFTVRRYRADTQELDIDFVAHGDNGPASSWATHAKPGDFLGFMGPSEPKVTRFDADWYLLAADPSAIPVVAATLEAMPRSAKGVAIFEITSDDDRQDIDMPDGIEAHWLVHSNPQTPSRQQEDVIRSLNWPEGRVQTCIAGESGVIKGLRDYLRREKKLPREDMYISGYWKIGMVEDEHQQFKRSEK